MSDMTIKSYTQQLVENFSENGTARLAALSESDLTSVIYWLETKQMELTMHLATEDDALQAAKYRGGIESFGMAVHEVLETLKRRLAEKEEKDE